MTITPCLWFDDEAEEAAEFYVSLFDDSRITAITHYGENAHKPAGTVLTVEFELDGTAFTALNGGPEFHFSEAVSFQIPCETQEQVDHFWDGLIADRGEPGQCGWLKDRYGVSWQVVPTSLPQLLEQPDREAAQRAFAALMSMGKLDIAALQAAAG